MCMYYEYFCKQHTQTHTRTCIRSVEFVFCDLAFTSENLFMASKARAFYTEHLFDRWNRDAVNRASVGYQKNHPMPSLSVTLPSLPSSFLPPFFRFFLLSFSFLFFFFFDVRGLRSEFNALYRNTRVKNKSYILAYILTISGRNLVSDLTTKFGSLRLGLYIN